MRNRMRRGAAWILAAVILFNLIPMSPTIASEIMGIDEPVITTEELTTAVSEVTAEENSEAVIPAGEDAQQEDSEISETAETTEKDTTEQGTTGEKATEAITSEGSVTSQELLEEQLDSKKADAPSETPGEQAALEALKVDGTISTAIIYDKNGNPINLLDYTGDPPIVGKDAKIEIKYNYKILNTSNLKVNQHCYDDLTLSGVSMQGSGIIYDRGNEMVGEWTLANGRLEYWFTDEYFLKNNITGEIEIEGTLNLNGIKLDNDGRGDIQIDDITRRIQIDNKDLPPQVTAEKTVGEVEYLADGRFKATYTITVTALTDTENVKIEDNLNLNIGNKPDNGNNVWIDRNSLSVKSTVNGKTTEITNNTNIPDPRGSWEWKAGISGYIYFGGTIESMSAGEVITITYDVYTNPIWYMKNSSESTAQNQLKVTDRFGKEIEKLVPFPEYKPVTVAKTGEYKEDEGKVYWEITVSNPYGMDLSTFAFQLTDKSTGYDDEIYSDVSACNVSVKKVDTRGIETTVDTISLKAFMESVYSFKSGSNEKIYKFVYSLKVKEGIVNVTDENTVTLTNQAANTSESVSAEVGIGILDLHLKKKGEKKGTNQILWTLTFTVLEDGLENVVIRDEYDDTLTFDNTTVKITAPSGQSVPYRVNDPVTATGEKKSAFEIEFVGSLPKGDYEIQYVTTYAAENTTKKQTYENDASIAVDEKIINVDQAEVEVAVGLEKRVVRGGSSSTGSLTYYGSTVQDWRLTLTGITSLDESKSYRIVDTWDSSNYEYVSGSLRIHSSATVEGSAYTFSISDGDISISDNGITIPISAKLLEDAKANGLKALYITYQTRIINEKEFLSGGENSVVKNTANLLEDGEPVYTSPTVTATSQPKDVVDKVSKYDKDTAPYAEYTISVNRGSNDLLKNSDTLQVIDTLPKDFALVENSLQVYSTELNNTKPENVTASQLRNPLEKGTDWNYSYYDNDDGTQTLAITIPDQREVIIKYTVKIEKRAGKELEDKDVTNYVKLSGVDLDSASDASSIDNQILQSKATARSTTANLTIIKLGMLDKEKKLGGATFTLKMVDYNPATGEITDPKDAPEGYAGPVSFTTKENESYTADNLHFDHLYQLVEDKAPQGYILDEEPIYFVFIGHDHELNEEMKKLYPEGTEFYEADFKTRKIENQEEGKVAFSKQEVDGTRELQGAALSLCDSAGNVITSWITGQESKVFDITDETDAKNGKLKAGSYILKETAAPDGYTFAEDIAFTISKEGKITVSSGNGEVAENGVKLIMRDDVIGDIYISKKSLTGKKELPGAHIVLKEKDTGAVVSEWDTTGKAKKLSGSLLKAGCEYVLTETAAPDGYTVTADITFTVNRTTGGLAFSVANVNKDAEIGQYAGASGDKKNNIIIRDKKKETTTEETTTEEKKTTEETTTEEKTTTTTTAKTGDMTPISGLGVLMIFSMAALLVLRRKGKIQQ